MCVLFRMSMKMEKYSRNNLLKFDEFDLKTETLHKKPSAPLFLTYF